MNGRNGILFQTIPSEVRYRPGSDGCKMCDLRSNTELHKLLLLAYGRQLEAQNSGLYGIFFCSPPRIKHCNGKPAINRHLSGKTYYVSFHCHVWWTTRVSSLPFPHMVGGLPVRMFFYPIIPLAGCVCILPWTSTSNYRWWFLRLTSLQKEDSGEYIHAFTTKTLDFGRFTFIQMV